MARVAVGTAQILARLTVGPLATRLATREYIPFGAWLLTWTLIGLAVGHADAVRLLAANGFVQAVRTLCALEVRPLLARRIGADSAIIQVSRRTAWRIDLLSLLAMAALLAGLVLLLDLRSMTKAAAMLALVGGGLVARHPGQLLAVGRIRNVSWRFGSAVVGSVGAACVLLFELGWVGAAVVLALRDWGGLAATLLFGPRAEPKPAAPDQPLSFAEAAGQTGRVARPRLTYRISKGLLAAMLGPVGGFAARTGRGAGLDSRLAKVVPRHRFGIAMLTFCAAAISVAALSISREPVALLLSAALLRVAASAGSMLLWWNYAEVVAEDDEEDDE
ncbi:MAG: hypothetical protein AVDCRST_MAG31-2008 [uncultured Sphingomonas sp.]|uniref:Uncharacterized protein n=1 Tax=uncultured Sphingomonas sp. TaxID=158754 RepID=A0A6J4TNJ3_9SPHN|nr:hypothetical protein [uncultured Sphingomonas sp.]CAA9526903.1 MAG: hypothetical protein AVDCRST_MAG31-2008 [uncultured Sphingomonas sp.]